MLPDVTRTAVAGGGNWCGLLFFPRPTGAQFYGGTTLDGLPRLVFKQFFNPMYATLPVLLFCFWKSKSQHVHHTRPRTMPASGPVFVLAWAYICVRARHVGNLSLHGRGLPVRAAPTALQFHTASNVAEKTRVEAAGGTFAANGRLFGKLHPTRSFGDQDIHRYLPAQKNGGI